MAIWRGRLAWMTVSCQAGYQPRVTCPALLHLAILQVDRVPINLGRHVVRGRIDDLIQDEDGIAHQARPRGRSRWKRNRNVHAGP